MGKKGKKIWIFHHYATPPTMSGLTRPYHFAKNLLLRNYKCTIFSSSYLHYSGEELIKDQSLYKEITENNVPFVFIKTAAYKNSKLLRVKNMIDFYKNLFSVAKKYSSLHGKPDVILASSAHPLTLIAGQKISKQFGIPCICEIRDLWPESFVAYNIISKKNPILKLLYAGEKWIYKKADKLIFTMEGGKDYIIEKGWDKDNGGPIDIENVYHINNGVDLEEFDFNKQNYTLDDEDLNNENTFKVVYAGSIRKVNNVKKIIEAAKDISEKGYEEIKFIIYGEGTEKDSLEKYCKINNLKNVIFKGYVEKNKIPYILSKSDLNIMHFQHTDLKKYGASLNKMFEYFASGRPTISDCEFRYDLIKKYNCGIVVDNANVEKFSEAIIGISKLPKNEYELYCKNAIKASYDYDFKQLSQDLIKILDNF